MNAKKGNASVKYLRTGNTASTALARAHWFSHFTVTMIWKLTEWLNEGCLRQWVTKCLLILVTNTGWRFLRLNTKLLLFKQSGSSSSKKSLNSNSFDKLKGKWCRLKCSYEFIPRRFGPKIRYKDLVRLRKTKRVWIKGRKMKILSDNILTGFEGSKETWKDFRPCKRTELD